MWRHHQALFFMLTVATRLVLRFWCFILAYISISHEQCFSVNLSSSHSVFISLLSFWRGVGVCWLFFSLVFYEWDVLFTLTELFLSVLMMNTYSVTTLTSSCITLLPCDWLMLSHWQRLRVCKVDVNVCVCACAYMHVGKSVKGSQQAFLKR